MSSANRSTTPRPKAGVNVTSVEKEGNTTTTTYSVVRKQSRPIGEFGGNWGCAFWTLFIPTAIWYLYGIVVMHEGKLVVPDGKFWYDLYFTLPAGLAIRPTFKGTMAYAVWILFQAAMEIFIPTNITIFGRQITSMGEGVTLKNGRRLKYPMNGLVAFFMTHVVMYSLCWFGFMEPYFVFKQMGALLTGGVILSTLAATWIYIDFGIFWKRHVLDPEFEEDWGVFKYSECINDWWLGVARNPRILHNWLKVPFDVKRFSNARPGLTVWVVCNQSYVAAMYFGCHLASNGEAVCEASGDWGRVGWAAILITIAHWYYIFDYNWNEPAYLTTTDIRHDLYGWMLSYGCCGFLAWYYSFSFLGHLAFQKTHPVIDNNLNIVAGCVIYSVGMYLFRVTNIEKHNFRSYIANGGDLSKYLVWGKPVSYIHTEEGSYLLTSGYWGLARHFNYIGDMVMCIGWAVTCGGPSLQFPWAPISYIIYFWLMDLHRLTRDEDRCAIKYKKDWERYKEAVPYFILPGVL